MSTADGIAAPAESSSSSGKTGIDAKSSDSEENGVRSGFVNLSDCKEGADCGPLKEEPSVVGARSSNFASASTAPAPLGFESFNRAGPFQMPLMENLSFGTAMFGSGLDFGASGAPPFLPVLIPAPIAGYHALPSQGQQGGVYAVPMFPLFGIPAGIAPGGLIPLSFNVPIPAPSPVDGHVPASSPVTRQNNGRHPPMGEVRDGVAEGLRQRPVAAVRAGQAAQGAMPQPPRQVVRRFRVGFQVDLLLLLKLAVVVFVFNQDGSKDRLMCLLFFAGVIYMYQTGALAPLLRWIQRSAQRAMMPPHPPAVAPGAQVRDGGVVPPVNLDADLAGGDNALAREPAPDGAAAQVDRAAGRPPLDEQRPGQPPQGNWWGLFKEVQMLVVGFLTSLLPGFQNVD